MEEGSLAATAWKSRAISVMGLTWSSVWMVEKKVILEIPRGIRSYRNNTTPENSDCRLKVKKKN